MQVHFGFDLLRAEWQESVVCIGTFDGVHLGHRQVIGRAVGLAREHEMPSVLVTFDRHPATVIAPDKKPPAIDSLYQNFERFNDLGVAVCVVLEFTSELMNTPAAAFYQDCIKDKLHASQMVVGHDFAFGHGREGNAQWLSERIPTHVVPPFELDGHRVSSSAIRRAVQDGDPAAAARWLGRPFETTGVVVVGERLGRTLGFPTINIARSFDQVTPADGVYACICQTVNGMYKAAVNVGRRPSVDGKSRTIEAYLIDYTGEDLYGTAVRLGFIKRLRDELKFNSLDELKVQMGKDVEETRESVQL